MFVRSGDGVHLRLRKHRLCRRPCRRHAAVRVTTTEDTIADVLSAFASPFKVKYRSAIPLDAAAKATYSGSFGQVISRLLDGYNYVIKKDRETTESVVFGKRSEASIPPKEPPAKGILSRWR
jgi:hypothetical protein